MPPQAPAPPPAEERLQNLLARAGVASRRHAAEMIRAGRVRVNGEFRREPGHRVNPATDRVSVDDRPLGAAVAPRTLVLHKPVGLICSADNRQGATVCDLVAHLPERLVPVGRLDRDSAGLLLLSNDGDLIARLTHPRQGHRKTYEVEVSGRADEAALARLRAPMELDGYRLQPVEVERLRSVPGGAVLRFVLREGRNRQIRRMCGRAGLAVRTLTRVAIGDLALGALPAGAWRDLTPQEHRALLGTESPPPETAQRSPPAGHVASMAGLRASRAGRLGPPTSGAARAPLPPRHILR